MQPTNSNNILIHSEHTIETINYAQVKRLTEHTENTAASRFTMETGKREFKQRTRFDARRMRRSLIRMPACPLDNFQ